jgi:hypothetical protein
MVSMMATLGGYLITLIARRPLGLQGTRGGPGAALGWTAGAEATGHVVAPELPWAGQRELEPQGTWRPRSCPGLEAGAGAAGHVAAPELPRAGSGSWSRRARGDAEAHLSREVRPGATACVAARGYTFCSLP